MNHKSPDNPLREFFQHRKIEPSRQSWDRLDAMLSVGEKPKAKKDPVYMWAAAITLVIAALITLTMIGDEPEHSSSVASQNISTQSAVTTEKEAIVASPPVIKRDVSSSPETVKINQVSIPQNRKNSAATKVVEAPISKIQSPIADPSSLVKAQPKKSEQTSETELIMASNTQVSKRIDIDAQSLLKSVEAKIAAKEKMELRRKYNIDSDALLAEAETESNKSFFNKVIKTIQETSGTVITAVNERNLVK